MRRECLDYFIPLGERHLKAIVKEFAVHYNRGRPHSSLGLGIPEPPQTKVPASVCRHKLPTGYSVKSIPVLGGDLPARARKTFQRGIRCNVVEGRQPEDLVRGLGNHGSFVPVQTRRTQQPVAIGQAGDQLRMLHRTCDAMRRLQSQGRQMQRVASLLALPSQ